MLNLKRVGLFVDSRPQSSVVDFLKAWFEAHQSETVLLGWESPPQQDMDLIIVMGGDGTVLHALGQFSGCPVLAINYGNVGFLTAGNKEDLEKILLGLQSNEYIVSERAMLKCVYPGGESHVVNEVVIRGATRMISVKCFINEMPMRVIRGDGVIVGTPTGSTAYLLSAGSPIVMPNVRCLILAGLNEYNFASRHLVLNHDAAIRLVISEVTKEQDIYLSFDGKDKIPLSVNDEIHIVESERRARLVFLDQNFFFSNLSSRLSW